MLCEQAMELLMPYLDHELDDGQKAEFEEHIKACDVCRAELALMQSILSASGNVGQNPPKELRTGVAAKIRDDKRKKLYKILSPVAVAAVLFVVIGLNFNTILSIFGTGTALKSVERSTAYTDGSTEDTVNENSQTQNNAEADASIQNNYAFDNSTSSSAAKSTSSAATATAGLSDMATVLPFRVIDRYSLGPDSTFKYGVLVPSSAAEILKKSSEFTMFAAGEPPLYVSSQSLSEVTALLKKLDVTVLDQSEDSAAYTGLRKNAQYGFIIIEK